MLASFPGPTWLPVVSVMPGESLASFPGRSCLQFLIACCMQRYAIKNWRQERPGNEARESLGTRLYMEMQFRFLSLFCRVMLNHRILLMNDGLDHNVIKIKPPLCFTKDNADAVLQAIDKTLEELLNWNTCTWLVNFYILYILHCTTVHIMLFISNFTLWMPCLCKNDIHQKPYFICVCRRVAAAWAQWFLSSSSRALACKDQHKSRT